MDPCLKQVSYPQNTLSLLSPCLGQHGLMHHGLQHPVHIKKETYQENIITNSSKTSRDRNRGGGGKRFCYPFEGVDIGCFVFAS